MPALRSRAVTHGRAGGWIRDVAHAYTARGGLAVLYGNLAPDGAIVKTAGVPEELLTFSGPALQLYAAMATSAATGAARDITLIARPDT